MSFQAKTILTLFNKMPEDRKSIRESIANIALRKQRAAETRFGRGPVAIETPKKVYDECCQAIAKAFEKDGCRYSKWAKCLTTAKGDFKFKGDLWKPHFPRRSFHWCESRGM